MIVCLSSPAQYRLLDGDLFSRNYTWNDRPHNVT